MTEKSSPRLMKDSLDKAAIARLRAALCAADPAFDGSGFQCRATRGLAQLELKERVGHLISAMAAGLPADYLRALPVVLAAGEAFPAGDPDDSRHGFAAWPLIDWVGVYGLDHFEASLAALRRLTPLFSAEFAIRPFLSADPQRALTVLGGWLGDSDHHVRRLVSEGTRPRLPWGRQLPRFREDPGPVLALLKQLRDDPSDYVRRSVANNLNDMAKDHPELVVATARSWWRGASPERQALVRHGLRTLVKQGNTGALAVLGFTADPRVAVTLDLSAARLRFGESQRLTLVVKSTVAQAQKLVIDYVVHHQRSGGKTKAKVFKWRNVDLPAAGKIRLVKMHTFVPRSVRRLYPGPHRVEALISGQALAEASFDLVE